MQKAAITQHELEGLFEVMPNSDFVILAHGLAYEYMYTVGMPNKIHAAIDNKTPIKPRNAFALARQDEEMWVTWLMTTGYEESLSTISGVHECAAGCGMCDNCVATDQDRELFMELFLKVVVVMEYDHMVYTIFYTNGPDKVKVELIDMNTTMVTGNHV